MANGASASARDARINEMAKTISAWVMPIVLGVGGWALMLLLEQDREIIGLKRDLAENTRFRVETQGTLERRLGQIDGELRVIRQIVEDLRKVKGE